MLQAQKMVEREASSRHVLCVCQTLYGKCEQEGSVWGADSRLRVGIINGRTHDRDFHLRVHRFIVVTNVNISQGNVYYSANK